MLQCRRDDFSLPPGSHYLNAAYMSPLSRRVVDAGIAGVRRKAVPFAIRSADEGVTLLRGRGGPAGVVLLFTRSAAGLRRRFVPAARRVAEGGRFWLAWPKKASGVATDLEQSLVRRHGLAAGWVDYKIAALDATWSGLCFARRAAGASGRPEARRKK